MFKLHHIQLAVSCITGVQICKDNIVNAMMGNQFPVSLAFEGDKVVIVNQGNVVFYTTTPEYSDDVQKFLDLTRAIRNMRKDLKGMEKQAKAYSSAPDKESEEKLQQKVLVAMKRPIPPVDLSELKEGDRVRLRNGTVVTIYCIEHKPNGRGHTTNRPYLVDFVEGVGYVGGYKEYRGGRFYSTDGKYYLEDTSPFDIVEVISQ